MKRKGRKLKRKEEIEKKGHQKMVEKGEAGRAEGGKGGGVCEKGMVGIERAQDDGKSGTRGNLKGERGRERQSVKKGKLDNRG